MFQFLMPAIQKLPHNQGLKEIEICFLTFLEATNSKSRCWQGLCYVDRESGGVGGISKTHFLPLIIFRFPWPVTVSLLILFLHITSCSSVCLISLCVYFIMTFIMIFRIHPDIPKQSPYLNVLNLITSEKTLYPNKVIFTGFGDQILVSIISLSQ